MKKIFNITLLFICLAFQHLEAKQITGIVESSSGEALIGVAIRHVDKQTGTVTDHEGKFTLDVVNGDVLSFSYIGFHPYELKIDKRDYYKIVLEEDRKVIDEVVVIGYGTARRLDITGAVTSVKSDAAEERLVMSVADVLKGKASGVHVATSDGTPGGGSSINIRGNTSISGSSSPLYVVDGIMMDKLTVSPGEIESIDILKDASSTAIYGSRGANGVILITTKKGKDKRTVINLYAMTGVQKMSNKLDMMNSNEFVDKNYFFASTYVAKSKWRPNLFNKDRYDFFNDDEGNFYVISKKAAYRDEYYGDQPIEYNTDWQDEMTRSAAVQDYRITISGSGDKNNYSLMGGYKSQEGTMINTKYENYSGRLNITQELYKNVHTNVYVSYEKSYLSGFANGTGGVIYNTLTQAPLKPADFGLDFVLPGEAQQLSVINPVKQAKLISNDNGSQAFLGSADLIYDINDKLTLKLTGGYFKFSDRWDRYYPKTVAQGMSKGGLAEVNQGESERLSNENTITYKNTFNKVHRFSAMAGMTVQKIESKWLNTYNSDFELEDLGYWGIGEGNEPLKPNSTYRLEKELSYFTRLTYDLKDRYLFKATWRADGASRFAEDEKWGYFPSGAFGWRMSEEPWMASLKPVLDNLKPRISWGITGKQAINPYQSLPVIGTNTVSMNGESNVLTSYFSRLQNSSLKWETTVEWNVGLDVSLWNDRLGLSFDAYNRETKDLLYYEPTLIVWGYDEVLKNIGKIRNRGLEVNLYATPIKTNDFKWNLNFNISKNISKVLKLGEQDWEYVNAGHLGNQQGFLKVGDKLGNWYGYKTEGIWQTQAEIDAAITAGTLLASEATKPGYMKYVDKTKDGKITADDRQIIGNGMPDFSGGFSNTLSYKGFTLDFTLQFTYGNDIYNATRYRLESGISLDNALGATADRWQPTLYHYDIYTSTKGELFKEGVSSNKYPIAVMGKSKVDETPIDLWVEDGLFIRLADVTLSYSIPKKFLDKIKMRDARVFVSGNNLLLITNYSGYDPEVNLSQNSASYLLPGMDYFSYPKSRTFSVGVNLTF